MCLLVLLILAKDVLWVLNRSDMISFETKKMWENYVVVHSDSPRICPENLIEGYHVRPCLEKTVLTF